MYLFDLQAKLKRLNDNLVVLNDKQCRIASEVPSYPLHLKFGKRTIYRAVGAKNYVDSATRKFMEMKENGQAGEFLCGVSEWTPEYDRFNPETGTLVMRGWRSLALFLVKKGVCSLERARSVFGESLAETDYDKLNFEGKLALARQEAN